MSSLDINILRKMDVHLYYVKVLGIILVVWLVLSSGWIKLNIDDVAFRLFEER